MRRQSSPAADPPDLLHVAPLAFLDEHRVAGDHDSPSYPREVGALGDAVDEMLLVGAAAKIGERQDDDGEARRAGFFGAGVGADFVSAGAPISSERPGSDRRYS
jgi:hypothetical protein